MQLLTFTIESEAYAIPSKRVIEVLPLVKSRPIPQMPEYIPGLFTYRGQLVPLVDLGLRIAGSVLRKRLSTRVIVVEFSPCSIHDPAAKRDPGTSSHPALARLGLIAENVVSIRAVDDDHAVATEMRVPGAAYLGRILRLHGAGGHATAGIDRGTVQLIELEHLLPDELLQGLFPEAAATAAGMTTGHAAE